MALNEQLEKEGNFLFRNRGILPIFILFSGLIAYFIHVRELVNKGENPNNRWYFFFCLCITLIGFAIRIYAVGFSAPNTSGRNIDGQVADKLNTTGIYSLIRHPLYLGNFFMWLGLGLLTENFWFICAFIFVYWVYYERIMFAEEQFLRRKFGESFREWADQTPTFIPNFSKYKKPQTLFNVKKVFIQEKTGLLLIGILYFIFFETGTYVISGKITVHYNFWFYFMIFGTVIYLAMKLSQKMSNVGVKHPRSEEQYSFR